MIKIESSLVLFRLAGLLRTEFSLPENQKPRSYHSTYNEVRKRLHILQTSSVVVVTGSKEVRRREVMYLAAKILSKTIVSSVSSLIRSKIPILSMHSVLYVALKRVV